MLVVADSSPFIVLANIGHLEALPKLFGEVIIPPAVASELADISRPIAVRDFSANPPTWLKVRRPASVQLIAGLHPGESEALSLAIELHADLIVIDDRRAYREAIARNLNAVGTIRVLDSGRSSALPSADFVEALERVGELHVDAFLAGELLGDENGWLKNRSILRARLTISLSSSLKFIDAEDGDDVLQIAVALQHRLHLAGDAVVLFADDVGQRAARRGQRIDGGINALGWRCCAPDR
jgi:predicted nucleic acid-binding protein